MVTSAGSGARRFAQSSISAAVAGEGSALIAAGGACASAAAACGLTAGGVTSPPPKPEVEEEGLSKDDDDEDEGTTRADGGCTPSNLGYRCMAHKLVFRSDFHMQGKVTLHWSLNTASAPSNPCTPASRTQLQAADMSQNGALHLAVQSSQTGYVSVGFTPTPAVMAPADIILGWVDDSGAPFLNTFHVAEAKLGKSDIYPPAGSPSWAYDSGVVRDAAGVTTICFSRRLRDARAMASPDLTSIASGSEIATAATTAAGGRRRLAQGSGGRLGLNWAVSPSDALVMHRPDGVGGLWLDVTSGAASSVGGTKQRWINAHGALMAVSWGLLLPLGTLLPAHRWALGNSKLGGKALWFVLHVFFQWTGVATFIAGFVIAYTRLGGEGEIPGGAAGEAHGPIGIAIMAAAGAQVVLAHGARPDPSSPKRRLWYLLHHTLGRSVILLAWANVYIGIYAYHSSQWQASYREWVTPIAVVMGALVLVDLALRAFAPAHDPAMPARVHEYEYAKGASGGEVGVSGDPDHPGGHKAPLPAPKEQPNSLSSSDRSSPSRTADGSSPARALSKPATGV
ncbi:hypothetical protein GPECTOR_11g272 [Gonium pectorale]|uniref:Cytochrome b561 domain-containing protein n=1 Tax=Gonium pectorale TaxID=33097 RepID=A0A150GPW3_GONPE|nr:hypothetical protein GPECTOR_11g272 [Gonium pectorale]|eukprot:KXZ51833.1 hypothetical protein GPECTOR_11g272 [Gonium pectorale]